MTHQWFALSLVIAVGAVGCNSSSEQGGKTASGKQTIRITGSDTMITLAKAWADKYKSEHPEVNLIVKGGGSGMGIAALLNGEIEIATASRPMKPAELEQLKKISGKEGVEHKAGLDALAIYAHVKNPIESISIPELAGIYGEAGKITKWSDLGVKNSECGSDEIIRVSRQNSSGTYEYFREAVLGDKGKYKQGAVSQGGSPDLVALVGKTPCAIGYCGMAYKDDGVKFVPVAKTKDDSAITPSVETVTDGTYPISRPLFLYTAGPPEGATKDFIHWVLSEKDGQVVVLDLGYVPLPKSDGGK